MIRVCHIISGDLWAGAEVMAYHLLKGLQSYDKLALLVITLNEGKLAGEIRRLGITVHVVDEREMSFFNILLTIRRILSKQPFDVIHSHRYKENILAYLISRSIGGLKLIATQHGMPEGYGGKTGLRHRIISKLNSFVLSRYFNKVVGVCQDIRNAFIKQYGFQEDKVIVIHNGIDIPNFPLNKPHGETFVVGSSGRLFSVKDYPLMVEIAKAVLEKTNRVSFKLAGEGPERSKLQALIQKNGLNSAFELKGHLEDISAFYQELDLYLNTSFHEGLPMSVLEAMAHGLPVVGPRVGGLREIVDNGVQGYLVNERYPEVFAEKCVLLYEKKTLRQRMSQAAKEKVVSAFSMEKMAEQYAKLYASLVKNC